MDVKEVNISYLCIANKRIVGFSNIHETLDMKIKYLHILYT